MMQKVHTLYGDELKKCLLETIEWEKSQTARNEFKASVVWLDEKDLRKELEGKPDDLEWTLKHGTTMMHEKIPDKTLWEVVRYTSERVETNLKSKRSKRTLNVEETKMKPQQKVAKKEPNEITVKDKEGISAALKRKLQKVCDELKEYREGLMTSVAKSNSPEFKDYVPKYVIDKCEAYAPCVDEKVELLGEYLTSGKGDHTAVTKTVETSTELSKTIWGTWCRLDEYRENAKSELGMEASEDEDE